MASQLHLEHQLTECVELHTLHRVVHALATVCHSRAALLKAMRKSVLSTQELDAADNWERAAVLLAELEAVADELML